MSFVAVFLFVPGLLRQGGLWGKTLSKDCVHYPEAGKELQVEIFVTKTPGGPELDVR